MVDEWGAVVEGALCGSQLVGRREKSILLCTELDQEVMSQRPVRASVSSSSLVGRSQASQGVGTNDSWIVVECLDA